MKNTSPDPRALALYEARARHHAYRIASANKILKRLEADPERVALMARALVLRERARRGLYVMQALIATWRRDGAARQAYYDQWERMIRQRFEKYSTDSTRRSSK